MSLLIPILAQAAAPEDVTVGGVISAVMFIVTAIGSMAMIAAWVLRYSQTGHALPAAQRGVLRVPWGLTLLAVVLSILFMILVLASSLADEAPAMNNLATGGAAAEVELEGAAKTATDTTQKEDAKTTKKPAISPEKMQDALVQTIAMDLVMLLAFGGIVMAASKSGRVHLTESGAVQQSPVNRQMAAFSNQPGQFNSANAYGSPWPDLDDASAIPQIPGYDILGGRKTPNAVSKPKDTHETPAMASIPPAPFEAVEHNPYAVGVQDERFVPNSDIPEVADEDILEPDEPFSFIRELRFATEVFLAAYLPTTALRLIIVLISIAISGETPKSHPFLEMLDQGIGIPMIAMILVMAVFVAPVVEELQFRVVALGGIAQLGWPKTALIVSSILFAFAHGFPDSIALIPLAFALGYTYLRRRSYVTVMLVHFLFNAFNMILALAALL